jgi:hypothetical protein
MDNVALHFPHVQPVVVLVLVRGVISQCSVLYPSLWNNSLMAFDIAESNSTVVVL